MTESSELATYNLKAVVQQTGIKPDTLRAWERRYGLPKPDRTAGGHRLYSMDDVETIKWLQARLDEGISISHAVKLWNSIIDAGQMPLVERPLAPVAPKKVTIPGGNLVGMRQEWINACSEYDERRANNIMTQAFALYPTEMVCIELLQKGLAQIGNDWYAGKISVQQEHFASALSLRRLDALISAAPPPTRNGRIITACAPLDDHTFSPLLLTLLLRRQGWDVIYLGGDVPVAQLGVTISKVQPSIVVFSAQLLHTAASLLDVAHLLKDSGVMMAYGGLVFNHLPAVQAHMPGHFLGTKLEDAPQLIASLIHSPRPVSASKPISDKYHMALRQFQANASAIEAEVWRTLGAMGIKQHTISFITASMTRNISSALQLGDIYLIGSDIEWVEGLLTNYQIPVMQLHGFIRAYRDGAYRVLDSVQGEPILTWLDDIVETIGEE